MARLYLVIVEGHLPRYGSISSLISLSDTINGVIFCLRAQPTLCQGSFNFNYQKVKEANNDCKNLKGGQYI